MSETADTLSNQYLTFVLDGDLYALEIASVREVLEYTPITRVPRTPQFMLGVINVRGHAVPVVDLRLKFGLQAAEQTVDTCIIIVEVDFDGESSTLGALVDGVEEVLEMEQSQIEPPPRMGTRVNTRFIQGIGKSGEQFVILLNIKEIFSEEELKGLSEIESSSSVQEQQDASVGQKAF